MNKNRSTLKQDFKKGAVPTESNFADLIDSMLNQEDDGISKVPNDPLSIDAVGGDEALINFYRINQNTPELTWQFKQSPGGASGFSIGDANGSRLFIASDTGNLGVGTTAPQHGLDVKTDKGIKLGLEGNGGGQLVLANNPNDNKIYLEAFSTDGSTSAAEFLLTGIHATSAPKISLVADTTKISGDLGVGTDSPDAKLQVKGDQNKVSLHVGDGGGGDFTMDVANGQGLVSLVAGAKITSDGKDYTFTGTRGASKITLHDGLIRFHTSDATSGTTGASAAGLSDPKMVLTNDGNLGVGTTSPKGQLHSVGNFVLGLDGNNEKFVIHARPNNNGDFLQITSDRSNGTWDWDQGITLQRGGNVGIATTSPNQKLDVNGNVNVGGNLSIGSIQLKGFSAAEADEWPYVFWYRDTSVNWDEGLIKHGTDKGKFGRAGFGIHFHQSREFGFFSTGWDSLFAVQGATGNTFIKGTLQIGGSFTVQSGNNQFIYNGAADVVLRYPPRGSGGRAIVHDGGNHLTLNYGNDFNGGVLYYGSLSQASSRMLKENFADLAYEEASLLLEGLTPLKFNLIGDKSKFLHFGFVAEDVPTAIAGQGGKTIVPGHILAVLTKVVKEQQKTIEALTRKMEALNL